MSGERRVFEPQQPEAYAEAMVTDSNSLQSLLTDPRRHCWPYGQYESIVAAQQLRALADPTEAAVLGDCAADIRQMMDNGRWNRVRQHVADGQPSSVELQLMLFAASGDAMHFHRRSKTVDFIKGYDLPGSEFLALLPSATVSESDRRSLKDYVLKKHGDWYMTISGGGDAPYASYESQVRFNEGSPHIPLIAYLDLMRMIGTMDLDVAQHDPVRDALIERVGQQLDAVRGSGEYRMLPQHLWWEAHALRIFADDRRAFLGGQTNIADIRGRQWQFLGDATGEEAFASYIKRRESLSMPSDLASLQWFGQSPEKLQRAFQRIAGTGKLEMLGMLWGVMLDRRFLDYDHEPITKVLQEVSLQAKQVLEPYVLEGMQLVSDRTAPHWLRVAVLESYLHDKPYTTVFTDAFGSIASDRAVAGAALAAGTAVRRTTGYGAFRAETALLAAYQLRKEIPPTDMLGKEIATRRMRALTSLYNDFRNPDDRRLPRTVRQAYEEVRRKSAHFAKW